MNKIKTKFPIFSKFPELAYLDNAATSQRPESVIDAITNFYKFENSNIHRGVYDLSNDTSRKYDEVRSKVAHFINAPSAENIGFTKGTTESINIVANSFLKEKLEPGDNIVTTLMEHHANFLPWQKLCEETKTDFRVVPVDDSGNLDMAKLTESIDDRTKILSVVHISNTLGTINPIQEIIELAHKSGVPVMIDAAQSAALYEIDAKQLDVDFLAFSGHKLFGPFGIGILYVNDKYREEIKPYNVGGGMIQHVGVDKTEYRSFPYNLEAGTSNVSAVVGLGAAVDFLESLDRKRCRKELEELTSYCVEKLESIKQVHLVSSPGKRSGIVSFTIEDIHPHDIASFMNQDQIAVRAGMHCTQPLLESMGISSTVRASFSIYNDKADADRLASSVEEIIKFWGMTKDEIKQLYKEKILPESKNAFHFEEKDNAELKIEAYNPMCGDKYKLFLDFDNNEVGTVHFHGIGCAISKASTSLLIRQLQGKDRESIARLVKDFRKALKDKDPSQVNEENLKILVELMNFDGRQDCIELSWKALEKELDES